MAVQITMEKFTVRVIFSLLIVVFSLAVTCLAQEQITITTYYPSPNGSYDTLDANNLQADRIGVGNGNAITAATHGNGVVDFLGLAAAPAGNAGSMYYNSVANEFRYHNGTAWVRFDIGPARLIFYALGAAVPCVPVGTHVVGVLTAAMTGADMGSPPQSGYIICH